RCLHLAFIARSIWLVKSESPHGSCGTRRDLVARMAVAIARIARGSGCAAPSESSGPRRGSDAPSGVTGFDSLTLRVGSSAGDGTWTAALQVQTSAAEEGASGPELSDRGERGRPVALDLRAARSCRR